MKGLLIWLCLATVGFARTDQLCVRHVVVPGYPRVARMARLQGSVTVRVKIASDGTVLEATGRGANGLLVRASEDNVRKWVFGRPPLGATVPRNQEVTYAYTLQGPPEYGESTPTVVLDLPSRVEISARPPEVQP